ETAELVLYARGTGAPLQATLVRRGQAIVTVELGEAAVGLPAGHIGRTVRPITIPANAPPGRYRLVISGGGESARIGTVTVTR
ncbi:MAG: hypothetical protein ABFD20_05610, partial [Anaerolineales bacterium]